MKIKPSNLVVFTFVVLLNCCKSANFDPTTLVQTGLDSIRVSKFGFPDTKELILVKDDYSAHLKNLHYGKAKLTLKAVPKQLMKYYYTPGDDTTKIYFITRYKKITRDSLFMSIEINHKLDFRFYFKPQGDTWKMQYYLTGIIN